jgi:DNA polymerase-3 subunit delta
VRLGSEDLARHLERALRPLYLFYGEEPLLQMEALDRLRAAARAQGFTEREVLDVVPGFDWGRVVSSCAGMSLFGDRKLLEIRIDSGKPGTDGSAMLREIAPRAGPELLIVVVLGASDRDTEKAAWFKALDEAGVCVRARKVYRESMPAWIRARLQAAGFRADAEAIALLAERVEGNLLAAQQEIGKLALLAEPGVLDVQTLERVITDSARYSAFDLCDRAFEGDCASAVRTLNGLRSEGEEVLAVSGALTWETRNLLGIAERLAPGQAVERALEQRGGRSKRHYAAAIRRLGTRGLQELLVRAARVDRCVKGLEQGDAWEELLALVIAASGAMQAPPVTPAAGNSRGR